MKKLVVAGIALLLVGTAAFAAVRIGVYGVCPLTGKPIHCSKSVCPPTAECPFTDERCAEPRSDAGANASADAMAAPQTVSVPSGQCAQTRRHCCCKEQAQIERQPAPAPASEPATRP